MIIGIDPGTTVGWAILDLEGAPVTIGSARGISADTLIATLIKTSKPLVVGSDKAKIPSFVQDIATKLGARTVNPSQDMLVDEKRELTSKHNYQNAHEMDALSSALAAFKKIQPLLNKIRFAVDREGKPELFADVVELVIKERISIHAALVILTPQELPEELPVEEEHKRDADIARLYKVLTRVRKDLATARKQRRALEIKNAMSEKKLAFLEKRMDGLVKPKSRRELSKFKEKQVHSLTARHAKSIKEQDKLHNHIQTLEEALLHKNTVALPRVAHLGWENVSKVNNIGSMLFVDDPNQMSRRAVELLRDKGVELIIASRLPSQNAKRQLPFAFVKAEKCRMFDKIVLVDKTWLAKVRSEKAVLKQIVAEYKKERATLQRV